MYVHFTWISGILSFDRYMSFDSCCCLTTIMKITFQGLKFNKNYRINSHNDSCNAQIGESISLIDTVINVVILINFFIYVKKFCLLF